MDTALCLADMAPPIGAKVDGSVRTKRGEHAFTHPEWDRPWRSKSQQRRAEELTAKEVEAETQARKNNVLRRQIQVTQAQLRKEASEKQADIAYLEEEHKLQTLKHEGSFTDFKEEASRREMALKRQLANLQRAKDDESRLASEEKRRLETQITTLSEGHSKELAQQVRNDKLEIDSLAKLLAAKDKELKEAETRHHKEALEALTSKDAASDALVKQLHEADENWRQALDDQQNRSNALRKEDLLRAEGLESKLKEANEKVAEGLRKISTLERKIGTLENDATGWANRLLSQVDTMVNSFTGTAPMVTILPKDKPANPLRERLWYRLQQLWELVNSQHDAERKMRDDKETKEEYQMREKKQEKERWEERRRDMLNLEQEMDDLRQKQERLSKAYEELRRHADDVEQSERYLTHRLHYFVDDVIVSEESRTQPTAPPAPRPGPMYIVFLSAQSTSLVSEKQLFKAAMEIFTRVVRTTGHLRGGYEAACKGDGFLFLFQNVAEAYEFALDVQLGLYSARWPAAVLQHTDIHGSDDLWNGVKCRIAVHYGIVEKDSIGLVEERTYHGAGLVYAAAVHEKTAPGQIVLSGRSWDEVQHKLDVLPKVDIVSLGMHTVVATSSGDGVEPDRLMQILPDRLAGRRFPPVAQTAALSIGHQETLCDATLKEVELFHKNGNALRRGTEAITEELEAISKAAIVTTGKLRNMQLDKPWKQEDMVGAYATIDEMMLRHDTTRKTLQDISVAQEHLSRQQRCLETAVAVHNESVLTESEHRREILIMKQKHEEQLHAVQSQCKAEAQRLLLSVMKKDEVQQRAMNASTLEHLQREIASQRRGYHDEMFDREGPIRHLDRHGPRSQGTSPKRSKTKRGSVATWGRSRTPKHSKPLQTTTPIFSPSVRSRPDSFLGGLSLA